MPSRRSIEGPHAWSAHLSAVIFDVDGVLVRSMEKNAEAYRETFKPLGIRIEPGEVFEHEGRGSRELIDRLARAHGLVLSHEQLDAAVTEHRDALESFGTLPLYPGVEDLLRSLTHRGLRLALVTGNWRERALAHFGDLAPLFDVVVSAQDVSHTKPHPEPYERALRELGLPEDRVVVVENAPLGIESAKAAGLRVIAVTTTNPRASLAAADLIVPDLAGVAKALGVPSGGTPK